MLTAQNQEKIRHELGAGEDESRPARGEVVPGGDEAQVARGEVSGGEEAQEARGEVSGEEKARADMEEVISGEDEDVGAIEDALGGDNRLMLWKKVEVHEKHLLLMDEIGNDILTERSMVFMAVGASFF